jgi:Ca2+-binding EF-hand superfamily protein
MSKSKSSTHSPDSHDQASTNYKEAFSLFDKRGTGRVALESLGDLLRACGQNPTLAEIADLEKSVGGDCTYMNSETGFSSRRKVLMRNSRLRVVLEGP